MKITDFKRGVRFRRRGSEYWVSFSESLGILMDSSNGPGPARAAVVMLEDLLADDYEAEETTEERMVRELAEERKRADRCAAHLKRIRGEIEAVAKYARNRSGLRDDSDQMHAIEQRLVGILRGVEEKDE